MYSMEQKTIKQTNIFACTSERRRWLNSLENKMTNLEENTKPKTVKRKVFDRFSSSINHRPSQKSHINNNNINNKKKKKTEDIEWTPIEPFECEQTSVVLKVDSEENRGKSKLEQQGDFLNIKFSCSIIESFTLESF